MIQNHVVCETKLPRESLKDFQGAFKLPNDKEIRMLADRIRTHGFVAPVFVWDGHEFLLDGHQRVKALNLLAISGETLEGDLVPTVYIKAPTEKEARQRVAEFNSKFSTIDSVFATEWLEEVNLFNLPMIDFESGFEDLDFDDIEGNQDREKDKKESQVCCPECGHDFII